MSFNKKALKPMLLAGAAAALYYAYTRLSDDQKKSLMKAFRQQGKDLLNKVIPALRKEVDQADVAGEPDTQL